MKHIVVIGNGVAGSTAARHVRKRSDHKVTMISDENPLFYSRTALMYIYMGHMTVKDTQPYDYDFWKKNRIDLIQSRVTNINTKDQVLTLSNKQSVAYDSLVIATGSCSNKFGWPGQDLEGVQGLYHLQDLTTMENKTKNAKNAVVVGGGLIGIEMVEMLLTRGIKVTMLVRENGFWTNVLPKEDSDFIGNHISKHHVEMRYATELKEIIDDGSRHVKAIVTNKGDTINADFVGLTVGVHPNTQIVSGTEIETDRGILVDSNLQTSIKNVYAIGDCAQIRKPVAGRRPIEAVWYTGKIMGETVASHICDQPKEYDPGIWFNSAKFFDVEYQTYGTILPNPPENQESFFWKSSTKEVAIRLNFEKDTQHFVGANLFGIRGRHHVFQDWIKNKNTIKEVLEQFGHANFDPEFFKKYELEIIASFNTKYGKNISLKSKKGLGFLKGLRFSGR